MYNPFSLLNAFRKKEIKSYWFATGTPTFLVNYLKEAHFFIPDLDGKVELNESGLETYRLGNGCVIKTATVLDFIHSRRGSILLKFEA